MSIRKSKRKIALCIASIFWAACENDSSTAPDVSTPPESSETNAAGVPHSSDTPTSSESASHLNYPYTLKLNTAVHCKDSTFLIPSPCPTSKPEPVSKASDLEETAPLYGIVNPSCTIPSKNLPVFTCDDGTIIPAQGNTPAFQVVADTIIQCALERNNGCPPAEEEFAKVIAETEASSVYPYKLAKDTTVNCKQSYIVTTNLATYTEGMNYNIQTLAQSVKCDDGNTYTHQDLLKDGERLYINKDTESDQ